MDSVPFQDGTQSQASVPLPSQNSLPDGCCCHDECAISAIYFDPCLLKKRRFHYFHLPAYAYPRFLIIIETMDIPVLVSTVVGASLGGKYCRSSIILQLSYPDPTFSLQSSLKPLDLQPHLNLNDSSAVLLVVVRLSYVCSQRGLKLVVSPRQTAIYVMCPSDHDIYKIGDGFLKVPPLQYINTPNLRYRAFCDLVLHECQLFCV